MTIEKYSDNRVLKIAGCGCFKPDWLQTSHNNLINLLFNKVKFKNTDYCLLINFTKKTLNYFNLKGLSIAICENQIEKSKVEIIWNKNNELFDFVFTPEEFYKWIDNMKIFDKIIMNPPYGGNSNLYGKITLEAKKHAKDVICLSPYLNYLSNAQRKIAKDVAKELLPYLNSYELNPVGQDEFSACFDKDLCIFHFTDNPQNKVNIDDIFWKQFSNPELTKSIITKIQTYKDFCFDKMISKKDFDNYEFKVAMTGTRGHAGNGKKVWDWTTILDEEKMTNFKIGVKDGTMDMYGFPFKTENECKEFVKWANSDIFGYLILIQKHSIGMDKWLFKIIPYFDFTKDWDDKKRCKELKLTIEEYNYIVEEMKDFGWKAKNK